MQNAVRDVATLARAIELTDDERAGIERAITAVKMKITPHVITMMDYSDRNDPVRRAFVPSSMELAPDVSPGLYDDVNADVQYSPLNGLVHRYPSKVLLFPANHCGTYCRYCFRRVATHYSETALTQCELDAAFTYIARDPSIEEVILSGGDPLVLDDNALAAILESIAQIPHIRLLRVHTRLPVTLPYRITDALITLLTRTIPRLPVFFVVHVASSCEISPPMKAAIAKLVDAGIPCFASCPLLRGVNDSEVALRNLWTDLLALRIKPYYLFHSDPVRGLQHFLVPLDHGVTLLQRLYDRMSGLAMPLYCFNVPGGGGHVLVGLNGIRRLGKGLYEITNFEGKTYSYKEHTQ